MNIPLQGFLAYHPQKETHIRFKVNRPFLNQFLTEVARENLAEQGEFITKEKVEQVKGQVVNWLKDDANYAFILFEAAKEKDELESYRQVELSNYTVEFEIGENVWIRTDVSEVEYSEQNQTEVYAVAADQIEDRLEINIDTFSLEHDISARIVSQNKL